MMRSILLFYCLLIIFSCVKPPEYSDVPYLEFRSFSKSTMNQGVFAEDSLTLVLYFTDGDGDFGTLATGSEKNVFIKDKRTGEVFREYKAPFVPEEGAGNGISGTISIKIYTTCCIYDKDTGIPPCEKSDEFPSNNLTMDVYIKDRSGNQSNTVTTTPILLNCR
ncbi:MAG: hypothetical protein IPN89_15925 [Saprospiraceae bacterium]|nr:hypothetical protein [Saprospiraceae bacterium]